MVTVSGQNSSAVDLNIPHPGPFHILAIHVLPSMYISPRGYWKCILLCCEALFCVLLSCDHVLSFPLILTSQCCLLHMSRLTALHYISCPPTQCPLFLYHHTFISTCPNIPFYHIPPHCVLPTFTYRCSPLIASNILSTPTPNPTPTPIPVKISDSDRLELRIIIVDSTSREMCVWMSL